MPKRIARLRFCAALVACALSASVLFPALPAFAAQGAPDVYAITNARLVTVSGKPIARGTIVLRDGLIEAVGEGAPVPADARVYDGRGLSVYPGLIDAFTHVGMPAAGEYPPARGDAYPVTTVRAENTAMALMKLDAAAFDARRRVGFGAALVAPFVGVFSGQSALVTLGTAVDPAALVVKTPIASHLNFSAPNVPSATGFGYPESLMGQIAVARQALYDAQDAVVRAEETPRPSQRPTTSRAVVALRPVVQKKLPLVLHADSAQAIQRALKLAREFNLRPIIDGGTEAYRVAGALKKADAAVLLSVALPTPPRVAAGEDDPSTLQGLRRRALAPRAAAALAAAGVPFAFSTDGLVSVSDFAKNVRKIIGAGLSADKAVEAATLAPARLLGVERQLGSLEPGKIANVVVVDGDLFGEKTKIKYLFVDGKKIEIEAPRPAPTGRAAGAAAPGADLLANLPAGVTPEMARQFIASNPDQARRFLPPGVTIEAAREALGLTEPAAPGDPPAAPVQAEPSDNPAKKSDTTDAVKRPQTATPSAPASTAAAPVAPLAIEDGLVPPLPPQIPASFVLRGAASVWTVGPQGTLAGADVFVANGKIRAVGTNVPVPAGTVEIDGRGKHVSPGLIDCHSHTAIDGGVNEGSNLVTAEVRVADVIDAEDVNIYRQLAGGTTAANLLHGSANSIGGQNAVVKWRWGKSADELLLSGAPPGIKFALGENPKQSNFSGPRTNPRYPATRMGVERSIRERFLAARDYAAKRKGASPPHRDLQLDALVEILEGKRLVHCHSYRQDEILAMIRVADEFGFRVATFQHVLEGYKVADEMAAHGAGGSTFSDWWAFKIEAYDAIPYNGALMSERGVLVSFNSDSSELARHLNTEAAKAVHWGGLAPSEAIKLVTINPARQLGIDKTVGSLEIGKDADIVVWSGDPLSPLSVCEKTFVDGTLVFDRQADLAHRARIEAEKKRLLALERTANPARTPSSSLPPSPPNLGGVRPAGRTSPAGQTSPAAQTTAPRAAHSSPPSLGGLGGSKLGGGQSGGPVTAITAIVGGTVHPVSGPAIPSGVVLMQNGKITAVGSSEGMRLPADVTRVEAAGLHVYPGLIDADTQLGLTEIGSIRATNDAREIGEFNPELRAAVAVNPDSEHFPVARANGVLAAVTSPTGGTLSGMGALLQLDGWTWEDLAVSKTLGLYVNLPTLGQRRFRETAHRCEEGHGAGETDHDPAFHALGAFVPAGSHNTDALRFGLLPNTALAQIAAPAVVLPETPERRDPDAALRPLTNFLDEARRYQSARRAENKGVPAPARDPRLEAMLSVLEGAVPLFVRVDRERDIRGAVAWAKKEDLRVVIVGGQEADQCADLLAKEKIPVILGPVMNLPARFDSPYDDPYTLPARLAKAGVRFCLSTGSAADVRRLPYQAAMAQAFGLPAAEALKAITLYPAQILGAGDRLGSLEPGKSANLLLTTGDPLEVSTQVKAAFIAGRQIDLGNKHLRLYEKYKARPKK